VLIDPKSNVPIFRQIADQLNSAIDAGVYKSGESLPSLRSLAVDIKVNPNTVQRAYDALEREGIVETRRGVGIFVAATDPRNRSAVERKIIGQLSKVIRQGTKSGLTPDRLRSAFDASMRQFLSGAAK